MKKIFVEKKYLVKKNLSIFSLNFLVKKNFRRKKIWSNKIPGQKKFWLKKFLLIKIFWLKKKFGPKCFKFLSKKLGRVNPGAGIYDPPPPENSRVKIVLNCC